MTIADARVLAKKLLSHRRYVHEKNVAAAARALAVLYKENPDKAELAAWLHDIVKEKSAEELRALMAHSAEGESIAGRPFAVWHGPCAAIYAKAQLGITDSEILSAIACHTTGKAGMSRLDKILLVADMISAERSFAGVDELRSLAQKDLNAAALAVLQHSLDYVRQTGRPVDEETTRALLDLGKKP